MASEDWGTGPAGPASSGPYAKIIGLGLAAALSTTAIFTLMHRDAFRHSSWGGVVAGTVRQVKSLGSASPAETARRDTTKVSAPATAPRTARLSGMEAPSWLPEGMNAVPIERSARLSGGNGTRVARADGPAGLRSARIRRSTRLALAEPAPSPALIRNLEAARPPVPVAPAAIQLPATGPLVQTASLETGKDLASQSTGGAVAPAVPAPAVPAPEQAIDVPLPTIRPVVARGEPARAPEPAPAPVVAEAAPANDGSDMPAGAPLPAVRPQRAVRSTPTRGPQPSSPRYELAYASPETTKSESDASGGFLSHIFGSGRHRLPAAGSGVAVYSIKDATVYMPNGEKLEAHSGMGHMTDKPRYADEKMRGPTPPNVYNLTMREHLFHGVQAVRMLPADGRNKFGRDGFLAHTYMLRGRPGESNGCVVFKNYAKFLRAFKAGKVDRMVVVPDLSHLPTQIASR